jgi:hypothetical protein
MAARRLILVMLALLVLSSIAAALIPVQRDRVPARESTTTEPKKPTIVPGTFVHRTISADAENKTRIRIRVGDQLGLKVTTEHPGSVEIPDFGQFENVDPAFPARFDILALEAGTFRVKLVDKRTIATIEVAARAQSGGGNSNAAPGSRTAAVTSGASSAS